MEEQKLARIGFATVPEDAKVQQDAEAMRGKGL